MQLPPLSKPGLFITATDTGVGKTVAACAVAVALRRQGAGRVGVCKPYATGCRRDREGLVSEDAEALAHFSDCRQPLHVINPIRYVKPLAPAVAAELAGEPPDVAELWRSLRLLDESSDVMLIEGVGGLMVPLDPARPRDTVLDLIATLGYPVAIVCRAGLGTLNHTAMTVRLLRDAGCRVAGLILNGYIPDPAAHPPTPPPLAASRQSAPQSAHLPSAQSSFVSSQKESSTAAPILAPSLQSDPRDESMATNRLWLPRMNQTPILATIPACPPEQVAPEKAKLPQAILEAVALTYWAEVLERPT